MRNLFSRQVRHLQLEMFPLFFSPRDLRRTGTPVGPQKTFTEWKRRTGRKVGKEERMKERGRKERVRREGKKEGKELMILGAGSAHVELYDVGQVTLPL